MERVVLKQTRTISFPNCCACCLAKTDENFLVVMSNETKLTHFSWKAPICSACNKATFTGPPPETGWELAAVTITGMIALFALLIALFPRPPAKGSIDWQGHPITTSTDSPLVPGTIFLICGTLAVLAASRAIRLHPERKTRRSEWAPSLSTCCRVRVNRASHPMGRWATKFMPEKVVPPIVFDEEKSEQSRRFWQSIPREFVLTFYNDRYAELFRDANQERLK